MTRWRLRPQLALGYAAATLAIVSIATVALAHRSDDLRRAETVARAQSDAEDIASPAVGLLDQPEQLAALLAGHGDEQAIIISPNHTVLAGSMNATDDEIGDLIDAALQADDQTQGAVGLVTGSRAVGAAIVAHNGIVQAFVITQADVPPRRGWRELFGLDARLGVVLALMAAGSGWLLAGRIARPLDALTDQVTAVALGAEPVAMTTTSIPEMAALSAATSRLALRVRHDSQSAGLLASDLRRFGHELRTPVTTARLRLEELGDLLEETNDGSVDRRAGELVAMISSQLDRLGTVGDHVMALGTPIAAGIEVDVAAMARRVVERVGPMARWTRVGCRLVIEGRPTVIGDEGALEDALSNLVENALKYTNRSGSVVVSARRLTADVVVEVDDDGPGFPAGQVALALQPGVRLVQPGPAAPGSGQGLAIVAAIVDRHRGRLEIEGRATGGTRVRIVLPAA